MDPNAQGPPPGSTPEQQQAWFRQSQVNRAIEQHKSKAIKIDEDDRRAWEIVTNVPKMQPMYAYGCAAGNLIIPGSGTIVCSFLTDKNLNKT